MCEVDLSVFYSVYYVGFSVVFIRVLQTVCCNRTALWMGCGCGANVPGGGKGETGQGKKGKVRKIEVKSLCSTASSVCVHKLWG